jgi:NADPH-dependent curcumin reductase CurA
VAENINKQVLLANRPTGWVETSNFTFAETEIPRPGDGEVLVRNIYMSVDPYMRGRMNDTKSYVPPFQIGEVLQAGVVGQVVESNFDGVFPGDYVMGMLGWENYSVSDGRLLRKIPAGPAPLSYYLGILGMPGMTAYVGLMKIAEAKAGDNVFVTAASGAVGSVVGQLAKIHGCRVVGSAGSDDKVALLKNETLRERRWRHLRGRPVEYARLWPRCLVRHDRRLQPRRTSARTTRNVADHRPAVENPGFHCD